MNVANHLLQLPKVSVLKRRPHDVPVRTAAKQTLKIRMPFRVISNVPLQECFAKLIPNFTDRI
jgi:hypothetical protein